MQATAVDNSLSPARRQQQSYLRSGLRKVQGWLDPFSATVIADLVEHQVASGVEGNFAEIGVYHGKLFLVAYLGLRPAELALAIDIFEHQDLNEDGSGRSAHDTADYDSRRRDLFVGNIRRYAGNDRQLRIISKSSLSVTPEEILAEVGPCRFFSVDGGHTADLTQHDLRLADATICEAGVVVIDDYFNVFWPSVSVGVARHMADPGCRLVPFLITPNKLFFCREAYASGYRSMLHARHNRLFDKTIPDFFDRPVDLYDVYLSHRWLYDVRRLKRRVEGRPLDNPREAI